RTALLSGDPAEAARLTGEVNAELRGAETAGLIRAVIGLVGLAAVLTLLTLAIWQRRSGAATAQGLEAGSAGPGESASISRPPSSPTAPGQSPSTPGQSPPLPGPRAPSEQPPPLPGPRAPSQPPSATPTSAAPRS